MRETMWFRAVIAGTFARIYRRHLRWFTPAKPENENGARARK